jgi:CxxC motif-containing protein (DUF1111 family)
MFGFASKGSRVMKRSFASLKVIVPLVLVLPFAYRGVTWLTRSTPQPHYDATASQAGRELFVHEWTPGDPLAAAGDGLGPVFNAKSCAECHKQGGLGGGGPLENNVTTFTQIDNPIADARDLANRSIRNVRNASAKPAETSGSTKGSRQGVVHSYATSDEFTETLSLLSPSFRGVSRPPLSDLLPRVQGDCTTAPNIGIVVGMDVSQRNTPALFGANLIDAIPDETIIANERTERIKWGLADSDTDTFPVGRALRLVDGHVGRFGWKAQTTSLAGFVRAACANELGLGNPSQAQPVSMAKRDYRAPGLDLTDAQCDQLTAFVATLGRPMEEIPESPEVAQIVAAGKKRFDMIGCSDCHKADVGPAKGIYSDLLLHRMGQTLVGGGTYGDLPPNLPDFDEGGAPQSSEWRTAPLWGVADSAPYLHDGRAQTLHEAIALHAGQGQGSADKFKQLKTSEKDELLAFLRTLRAPRTAE